MEDLYYKSYMFEKNGKKKILIDYSWINQKLSGGGLKSCENLHKIFEAVIFNGFFLQTNTMAGVSYEHKSRKCLYVNLFWI